MEPVAYTAIPGLEQVYFEDSFVLGLCLGASYVELELDLVLTPGHRAYVTPSTAEQHCMRRATLRFSNVSRAHLTWVGTPAATDAAGEKDFGNLDSFHSDGQQYCLSGPWGELRVVDGTPGIIIGNRRDQVKERE